MSFQRIFVIKLQVLAVGAYKMTVCIVFQICETVNSLKRSKILLAPRTVEPVNLQFLKTFVTIPDRHFSTLVETA